jgi:hypothetical protein
MNNIRRLVVLYWRHSKEDRENSWTKELYEELIYADDLRLKYRNDMQFVFANVNVRTESYNQNRYLVEELRKHKERYHPLVYIELVFPLDGRRELLQIIENKHDINKTMRLIRYLMNEFEK